MRDYTDSQVTALLRELHERGRPFGVLWGSASTNGVVNNHILVNFGNASVSTVLNLLDLLRDAEEGGEAWES
ncbi:hypothetical protein [Kitasatospora sp. NPDC001175]|uniref:hypothetical protein n=1 Tax=Kitasatospora sp. NPDC001175 TaxID=3157103 RepID=UPI003D038619